LIGSDTSMKGSKVSEVCPHLLHVNVLLSWPTNISAQNKVYTTVYATNSLTILFYVG